MTTVGAVCAAARRGDVWGSVGRDGLLGMSGPVSSLSPVLMAVRNLRWHS